MKTIRIIASQQDVNDPIMNVVENDTGISNSDLNFKRSSLSPGRYGFSSDYLTFSNGNTSIIVGGERKSPLLGQEVYVKDDDQEDTLQFVTLSEGVPSDDVLSNTTILIQFFAL